MLWGHEVGRLSIDMRRGLPYFEYSHEWLENGMDISPLNASISMPQSRRPIYGASDRIYQKLPPFLADSLPDAWGNELFEQWRQQEGLRLGDITPLDKLAFIGRRAMGALEFLPEAAHFASEESVQLQSLIQLANKIYTERENARISPNENMTMQALMSVGTSAGGRQPKAIIAINKQTGEIRSGQVENPEGFDYCILKFNIPSRSMAELEMAYYKMAVDAGIKMTPCWLMEVDGVRHFVTKRFDRIGNKKVHMQTLAALYPCADSYERLLWVCRKMRLSELECEEVFRRMVFNILANNTDDHNKNFSFLMDENGSWSLSPAYDMTFIFDVHGFLPETQHCMMVHGKLSHITLEDVLAVARENGIRRAEKIIQTVSSSLMNFRSLAERYCAHAQWISAIENTIQGNMRSWGLVPTQTAVSFTDGQNRSVENIRIKQQLKGNFLLLATINGTDRKFIIRKGTKEHERISMKGISRLSEGEI